MASGSNRTNTREASEDRRSAPELSPELERRLTHLAEYSFELFESALKEAFEGRKQFFAHELYRRFNALKDNQAAKSEAGPTEEDWIGVESLSRLRGVVGGRFQNLKKKWTDAGFPLRAHRGDKEVSFKIHDKSWIELSNWILKQGYEARLAAKNSEFLFMLRKKQKGS